MVLLFLLVALRVRIFAGREQFCPLSRPPRARSSRGRWDSGLPVCLRQSYRENVAARVNMSDNNLDRCSKGQYWRGADRNN